MSEYTETIVLLFTQFLNGKMNAEEFSFALAKEHENEEKTLVVLQNNLKAQQDIIERYVVLTNKQIFEMHNLDNQLREMATENERLKGLLKQYNTVDPNQKPPKKGWWPSFKKFLKGD